MGTQSQKKHLVNVQHSGSSPKKVARKIAVIFAEGNPDARFEDVSREFAEKYKYSLFALCEIWHQLRVHNHTLDAVAQAFAEKLSRENQHRVHLEGIIRAQKDELTKKDRYIVSLQSRLATSSQEASGHGTPKPQSSET
jgi:hypothetical protein